MGGIFPKNNIFPNNICIVCMYITTIYKHFFHFYVKMSAQYFHIDTQTTKPCAVGQLTDNSREKLVAPDAAIYGNSHPVETCCVIQLQLLTLKTGAVLKAQSAAFNYTKSIDIAYEVKSCS
jgi:hypothetical protein